MMKIEKLLTLASDMERFSPGEDKLAGVIWENEDELFESELELVAAAGAKPPYEELIKNKR